MLPAPAVVAAAVAGAALVGLLVALLIGGARTDADAAQDAEASTAACADGRELRVLAAPDVTPTLRTLADRFRTTLASDGRPCMDIAVSALSSPEAVDRLADGWDVGEHGPAPHVWVPDSSAWAQLVRERVAADGGSSPVSGSAPVLARSPMVIAMPASLADALPSVTVKWRDVLAWSAGDGSGARPPQALADGLDVVVTDPLTTTPGLLTLLSLGLAQDEIWSGGPTGSAAVNIDSDLGVLRFRRQVSSVAPDLAPVVEAYRSADEPSSVFGALPMTERSVLRINRGEPVGDLGDTAGDGAAAPQVPLRALYPTEGAVAADYPYVALRGPWVDAVAATAANEFATFLSSDAGRAGFLDDGFRDDRNGSSELINDAEGVTSVLGGDVTPVPESEVTARVRASWASVTTPSATLLAVDVSGSMLEPAGTGDQTRLEATIAAAERSLDVLPVSSDVGLWEFSTGLEGGRNDGDYRVVVELGPLDGEVDGEPRADALATALRGLEPANDTALHDTILAAYRRMRDAYEPGRRHAVVLLTDGRNDDRGSPGLARLLERLEDLRDPQRPVSVIAIAYGEDVDVANLNEITDLTGGKVLRSPDGAALDELFLEALSGA